MPKELSNSELTSFVKRLQAALKRRGIIVSLKEIKEAITSLISDYDNQLTEEVQHICLDALIRKYQPSALVEPESVLFQVDADAEPSSLILTPQQKHEIVTTKASSMGIVLAESDVIAIADQLDYQVDSSVEGIIAEAETLLTAYADHKKNESKQKVNAMLDRVYNRVQDNNSEVSEHLSHGLKGFATDLEVSNQEFKRQAKVALQRLRIPGVSA